MARSPSAHVELKSIRSMYQVFENPEPERGTNSIELEPRRDEQPGLYYLCNPIPETTSFTPNRVQDRPPNHSCPEASKSHERQHDIGEFGILVPVFLKFEDVNYKVSFQHPQTWCARKAATKVKNVGANERHILNGITGYAAPGEILAMMGPSGSGKTTLLKIIGGRLFKNVSGSVTYNDLPYGTFLKKKIGFVTQDDVLFPYLTVQESLIFSALLRLSGKMTREQKLQRAESVLKDLGLERCRNTIVGGPFICGVSGGERKRTSIGTEILVNPSLLLLDEPTSGLDSATALKILQVLEKIAQGGRTVITTIHQPSSRMFHMFNNLILISEGHPLYSGPARDVMEYFASLRFSPQMAMNPGDFLLDLAVGLIHDITYPEEMHDTCNDQDASEHKVTFISNSVSSHNKFNIATSKTSPPVAHTEAITPSPEDLQRKIVKYLRMKYKMDLEPHEKEKTKSFKVEKGLKEAIQTRNDGRSSWALQFAVLFKRTFQERSRDYFDSIRFVQAIGVSIVLGLLWWQSKLKTERDIRDQVGLLFYVAIFWSTTALFTSVSTFPLESTFLIKEMAADMYKLSAYYMSSTLSDIVADLVYPTIFTSILYFMAGLQRSFSAFSLTLISTYILVIASQGAGDFFGAAIMNVKKSGTVASLVLLLFLLTGGYYVQHMPIFMKWMKYLSFIYHGFRLLLKIQYSPDQVYDCDETAGCKRFDEAPMFTTIDLDGGGLEVLILLLMAVLYRIMAYFFLRRIRSSTH